MASSDIGRNDPCPCGSGKKYKKCCLDGASVSTSLPVDLSPAELVHQRARAFAAGDFGFIFDSYHPESNFRSHFADRQAYIATGRSSLGKDFRIDQCRVLKEEIDGSEARVLFYLDTRYRGQREESFEAARLLRTADGWRYHSSQKLSRDEFAGAVEEIDWADFERVKDKVFF